MVTFAEFVTLPDHVGKRELVNGEVVDLPPLKMSHMVLVQAIQDLLRAVFPRKRTWIETGYQTGPNEFLIPDVSISYADQRVVDDYFQGSPMLAVEVTSSGIDAVQLDLKLGSWLRHGVQEVWIVIPGTRSMMVFYPSGKGARITDAWISPATGLTFNITELIDAASAN